VPVERIWLRGVERPPPPRPTPRAHAAQLLRWVRKSYSGKMVLAMDLAKIYPVMCGELDWQPHKWQPVAVELRNRPASVSSIVGWMGTGAAPIRSD
jgi:hypothetical protein